MQVLRWDPERDGPMSEAALRAKLEMLGYAVAVVSRPLRITMGKESAVLEAGDAVVVPRGAAYSAEVVGDEPVVSLDGIRRR